MHFSARAVDGQVSKEKHTGAVIGMSPVPVLQHPDAVSHKWFNTRLRFDFSLSFHNTMTGDD